MRTLRRAAALAVGVALGVAGLASPVLAAPTAPPKPVADPTPALPAPVTAPKPGEAVPKDKSGRVLLYLDGQQEAGLRDAVGKVGGEVTTAQGGRVQAAVPADKVAELAKQPAVQNIRRPERALPMAVTSEGVSASGADAWIKAGSRGAGVKIGIIDVGFDSLADIQNAGELPATGPQLAINTSNCHDTTKSEDHGTSVAEVVHDMAPDASLYLACIDGPLDFAPATDWLQQQGVQVITAAVGFLTSGRGDGGGEPGSPADVVKRTRQAGILWSVAAGNLAATHFAGKAVDADGNGFVEFSGTAENNGFNLAANHKTTVGLRWDAWPKTNEDLDLYVMKSAHPPTGPTDPNIMATSVNNQRDVVGGARPTEEVTFTNTDGVPRQYFVYVKNNTAKFTTSFDLFVFGADGKPGDGLQYVTAPGSVTEPATSPYAMAVGATKPGSGALEFYSGQGPTIDGRMKPDITGFDAVSTALYGPAALVGTSAAAAHVAGAAAILKSANPQLDAAQLQASLQSKANPARADNQWGSGTLALGTPDTVPAFTGNGYTSLPEPIRIHSQAYTVGQIYTLKVPNLPADATAVALTISGRSDVATGFDLFPGDPTQSTSKATTLAVRPGGGFTSVSVIAPVGKDGGIRVRNRAGNAWLVVEEFGYFSAQGASTYFAKPSPERIVDTRGIGATQRTGPLAAGTNFPVTVRGVAGVPQDATSVVINLTGVEATDETYLSTYAANPTGISALSLRRTDRRSNMVIVPIAPDGTIKISNTAGVGSTQVIVDVVGWFSQGSGARYVALPEASRIVDTATGTGLRNTPLGQGEIGAFQVGGLAGVSRSATTAVLTVTGTEDTQGTELTINSTEVGWSPVTNIGIGKNESEAGTVFAPLGASGQVDIRNERGQARVAADVSGYFVGGSQVTGPVGNCVLPRNEAGFASAFDGRAETGLDGWQVAGTKPILRDGCELATDTGTDVSWYALHTYANDYTLKLDWKATTDNADSGVFVGFANPGGDPAVPATRGLEVQIGPKNATGTLATGGIVGFQAPTSAAAKPTGQWNTFEITVGWNMVTVLLNGQKVNEYTSTDPNKFNVNSFVGLQNNGGNSQVRFRDVRIKRNTPVRSGTFVGANNRCLDLANGNPDNTLVRLWDCNGGFAQAWSMLGDGTVQAAGKCLTVDKFGTANGTAALLWDCGGEDSQQWLLRQDGALINPHSGRCLTPASGDLGAATVIQDCAGRSDQVWRAPNPAGGRVGALTGPGGRCLDVPNNNPLNVGLRLWDCNGGVAQQWSATGDGTVRADGKCLTVDKAGTAAGTAALLWECNADPAQQWLARADGTLVNPKSGRCLTAASGDSQAALSIQDCLATSLQQWQHTFQTVSRGPITGVGGKCVDVMGSNPSNSKVWLWTCYGPTGQLWYATGDGTVQSMGKCLDVVGAGTANATEVELWQCNGNNAQQWVQRPNGALVNPVSNRVLDDQFGNTTDGNYLQIYDWNGGAYQRWSTPAHAS
ncbi:DUF1080 domain-containing protein [Solihabitans fulvus]|uniref:DUF1080 domain-containing protein n=1 Tax=Solihabitans fulvus TaxID=1892852 RepID=A0A5B2X6A4_9PSEU|nr:ricin-type beta-trefoil lectin domain protein [Solihabitans fulvus]KAA2258750.1 DUF1080 domain-containing protein [Solihabitans fulvus]